MTGGLRMSGGDDATKCGAILSNSARISVPSDDLKVFHEYSQKYGKKTAVLMCVGSFFEISGVDNGIDKFGNARELSQTLNIVLTRKKKESPSFCEGHFGVLRQMSMSMMGVAGCKHVLGTGAVECD